MLITKHQKIDKERKTTTKITHNRTFLETTVNNTLSCILVDFLCMNFLFFNTEMGIHYLFSFKNIIERFASESQLSRDPRADHCHCPSILQSAPDNI